LIKKIAWTLFVLFLIMALTYTLGPKSKFKEVNNTPKEIIIDIKNVASYIADIESSFSNIKPDNQSQFIWQDSTQKTEYALLYLHGYSASYGECSPILQNFSDRYRCNTYLHRLKDHGLNDDNAFAKLTPESLVESAKEAVAIAKNVGEKLLIISTSTGCTLATYLAAADSDIEAIIMTAPNFDLYDQNSHLMLKPWGKQILKKIVGGNHRTWEATPEAQKYWTTKNRIEGLIAMRSLLDQTMTDEIFSKINVPVFVGYYYKDANNQDEIISINAIKEFQLLISTPPENQKFIPYASAKGHVISSKYMNPNWKEVQDSIFVFAENILNLPVADTQSNSVN